MRVLVTGASGDLGGCIIAELLERGHQVIGLSRRPHSLPSRLYSHVAADIRDTDAIAAALSGVDAVVHLAWTTDFAVDTDVAHAIDVGGTRAVVDAMERVGIKRLVCASSIMAYGANRDNPPRFRETAPLRPSPNSIYSIHKGEAERLVADSPINSLIVRSTNCLGRTTSGVVRGAYAPPTVMGMKGCSNTTQFVHPDDLARFYADALEHPDWSGIVNVAADGVITMREVADIQGKRYVELPPERVAAVLGFLFDQGWISLNPGAIEALMYFPIVDTSRLREEFGFRCAWTADQCVEDFVRANRHHVFLGNREVTIPWRWPWAWVPAPSEYGPKPYVKADASEDDEFGSTARARDNLTPLSLELTQDAERAAMAQCSGPLRVDTVGFWGSARRLLWIAGHLGGFMAEMRSIDVQARLSELDAAEFAQLSDAELHARLYRTHDEVAHAWAAAVQASTLLDSLAALTQGPVTRAFAARLHCGTGNRVGTGVAKVAYSLAQDAKRDPTVTSIFLDSRSDRALERLRLQHPNFAVRFEALAAEYGHCGPQQSELASSVFADCPSQLLEMVARLIATGDGRASSEPEVGPGLWARLLIARRLRLQSGRVRDAVARRIHQYRLITREIGERLAQRDIIERRDDVFYLIRAELKNPPTDAKSVVAKRRAELTGMQT